MNAHVTHGVIETYECTGVLGLEQIITFFLCLLKGGVVGSGGGWITFTFPFFPFFSFVTYLEGEHFLQLFLFTYIFGSVSLLISSLFDFYFSFTYFCFLFKLFM